MRDNYYRQLNGDDYRVLAAIAHRQTFMPADKDARTAKEHKDRLLFYRYALEYRDQDDELYVDVHPLVIEIEEFRRAYHNTSPLAGN